MRPHPSLRDSWQLVAVGEVPVIFFVSGIAFEKIVSPQCMASRSGLAR